jgi:hypothetical protein
MVKAADFRGFVNAVVVFVVPLRVAIGLRNLSDHLYKVAARENAEDGADGRVAVCVEHSRRSVVYVACHFDMVALADGSIV